MGQVWIKLSTLVPRFESKPRREFWKEVGWARRAWPVIQPSHIKEEVLRRFDQTVLAFAREQHMLIPTAVIWNLEFETHLASTVSQFLCIGSYFLLAEFFSQSNSSHFVWSQGLFCSPFRNSNSPCLLLELLFWLCPIREGVVNSSSMPQLKWSFRHQQQLKLPILLNTGVNTNIVEGQNIAR